MIGYRSGTAESVADEWCECINGTGPKSYHLFDPYKGANAVKTIVLRQKERRKPSGQGFETISDIIHRLEDHIIPHRFDAPLSLQLDGAHILREEMSERRPA